MLIELNRQDRRDRSVTATDLPLNAATTPRMRPVVAVFGRAAWIAGLESHLPGNWSLRRPAGLDDVRRSEIVLFAEAGVAGIAAARALLPNRTLIVALVAADAPGELVAGVLTAGADVCVRAGQPAVLAGHLVACRRRQLAGRWAELAAVAKE